MRGARKMEILPEKANSEKARACVFGVLISLIIVLIVTVLPEKMPARHRNKIICHILRENPKIVHVMERPSKLCTRRGLRPS